MLFTDIRIVCLTLNVQKQCVAILLTRVVGHLQSVKTHLLPRAGHNQNRHAVVVNGEGVDVLGLLPREILRAAFVILEHVSVSPAWCILTR